MDISYLSLLVHYDLAVVFILDANLGSDVSLDRISLKDLTMFCLSETKIYLPALKTDE